MTSKLYYERPYDKTFEAQILSQTDVEGKNHVVLDQTLFYPSGGGQPCDLGTINGVAIEDVFEEKGVIVHVLAQKLTGEAAHGKLDWRRRYALMQQHLGQHMLSAVFVRDYDLATVGMRLRPDALYIDLDGYINEESLANAEMEANRAIYAQMPVEFIFPSLEEIRLHSRRDIPETDEAIRIVKVGNLDYVPCCGLHCQNTAEVGMIKVHKLDTHKHGSRIHFVCGLAALKHFAMVNTQVQSIAHHLTCAEGEVADRVLKLHEEVQSLKEDKNALQNRIAALEAAELLRSAPRIGDVALVTRTLPNATQVELKQLFAHLTENPGVVVVLGGHNDTGAFLMMGCNKTQKGVDVREAFRTALTKISGKGGGGPCYAQGFGSHTENLEEALKEASETIHAQLKD